MTIEELKAAYAAGAKIQIRIDWTDRSAQRWFDIEDPFFDVPANRYRIKPTNEEKTP